jgi:hypothetical protein
MIGRVSLFEAEAEDNWCFLHGRPTCDSSLTAGVVGVTFMTFIVHCVVCTQSEPMDMNDCLRSSVSSRLLYHAMACWRVSRFVSESESRRTREFSST